MISPRLQQGVQDTLAHTVRRYRRIPWELLRVGPAVGIALRSEERAGSPANAGGTAEASSFVPGYGMEGVFLWRTNARRYTTLNIF